MVKLSFTVIHKGVESPSEGMSIDNGLKDNKETSSGIAIKEGNVNDPGHKADEEKNGERCNYLFFRQDDQYRLIFVA